MEQETRVIDSYNHLGEHVQIEMPPLRESEEDDQYDEYRDLEELN